MKKNILSLALLLLIIGAPSLHARIEHLVQPGETLYSLHVRYNVSVEAIQAANPKVKGESILAGMTLYIPEADDEAVAKTPIPAAPVTAETSDRETPFSSTYDMPMGSHWTDGTLTLALIMPFELNAVTSEQQKTQSRMVEFYKGVLMAVDEMQEHGRKVCVQSYDVSTQTMENILAAPELSRADVIFGPLETGQLSQLASYAEETGTPVVSPFTYDVDMQAKYKHLFQLNTPKSIVYPQITEDLLRRFRNHTIVFLSDSVSRTKEDAYPAMLRHELDMEGRKYQVFLYGDSQRLMACDSLMGLMDQDVLFVPLKADKDALRRMFSGLQHVKILREARYSSALESGVLPLPEKRQIAVLGYPEWVLYTQEFTRYFYDLNVHMFTKVYVNPLDPSVKAFYSNFRKWYGRDLLPLIPKYGMLGYDLAGFFMRALSRHGQHLEERICGEMDNLLQSVVCFDRQEEGGFYNNAVSLVHYTSDSKIEKIVIQ